MLCTVGCAATPTYVTKHGLRIFDKTGGTVVRAELEAMVDRVLDEVNGAQHLRDVDVTLIPEWIEISQMDGSVTRTDGYTNSLDGQVLASVFSDCLFVSGLVHEIAHITHDKPRGVPDWTHDDAPFWEKVELLEQKLRQNCSAQQLSADAAAREQAAPGVTGPAESPPESQPKSQPDARPPETKQPLALPVPRPDQISIRSTRTTPCSIVTEISWPTVT